jgi:hypothetical protein
MGLKSNKILQGSLLSGFEGISGNLKKPSLLCRGLQKIEAVEVQHDSALQQSQRPAADTGDYLALRL